MSWETIVWIIIAGAFSGSLGYSMGMDSAKRDQEEREQKRKDAQEAQRQREVEADRKDAGLPPLYPDARRTVDLNDIYIDRDERELKKLGLGPRYPEARARVDAEDAKREAMDRRT
jgi:hypothetical protein